MCAMHLYAAFEYVVTDDDDDDDDAHEQRFSPTSSFFRSLRDINHLLQWLAICVYKS